MTREACVNAFSSIGGVKGAPTDLFFQTKLRRRHSRISWHELGRSVKLYGGRRENWQTPNNSGIALLL